MYSTKYGILDAAFYRFKLINSLKQLMLSDYQQPDYGLRKLIRVNAGLLFVKEARTSSLLFL
jgi:hypothetical protein